LMALCCRGSNVYTMHPICPRRDLDERFPAVTLQ
jgi:hypothetical protein